MNKLPAIHSITIFFLTLFTILAAIQLAQSKPIKHIDEIEDICVLPSHASINIDAKLAEEESHLHQHCVREDEYNELLKRYKINRIFHMATLTITLGVILFDVIYHNYIQSHK